MLFSKDRILSTAQLKRLADHKYSCTSSSLLDKLMQPWWNWLVTKLPLWLAPNLITIVGLVVNIFTSLIIVFYSPDARSEVPKWACLLCAAGMFFYQSLDAIDGKQARRTGTSSPLGELFDHGCDSISTVFASISGCVACRLGAYPEWVFAQCVLGMILFYFAHWQTYVSGTLRFGKFDVTEAQFGLIAIYLVSGVLGISFWEIKVPVLGLQINLVCSVVIILLGALSIYNLMYIILTGGVGKNGSTVAGTSVLSPVIPFSLVVVPAFIIWRKSIDNVYENHPALYMISFGLVSAKVTNKLVVAHMTRSEMSYLDSSLLGPLMLFLNQYFNFYVREYYVLWLCLIWTIFDLLRYCSQVCIEICDHLNIHLFKIPSASPSSVTSSNDRNGMNTSRVLHSRAKAGRAY